MGVAVHLMKTIQRVTRSMRNSERVCVLMKTKFLCLGDGGCSNDETSRARVFSFRLVS